MIKLFLTVAALSISIPAIAIAQPSHPFGTRPAATSGKCGALRNQIAGLNSAIAIAKARYQRPYKDIEAHTGARLVFARQQAISSYQLACS